MELIILFIIVGIIGVAYFIYDMHNQKKMEQGYWLLQWSLYRHYPFKELLRQLFFFLWKVTKRDSISYFLVGKT